MLPILIGTDSDNNLQEINLNSLPHLFVSYSFEQQMVDFFCNNIRILNPYTSEIFLLLSEKNANEILSTCPDSISKEYHIRNAEVYGSLATKKIFFQKLLTEIDKRVTLFRKTSVIDITEYNKIESLKNLPRIIIFIDDTFDLLSPSKANTGLSFMKLLLSGHPVGIHCITASTYSYKNLVTQLLNLDIRTSKTIKKFVAKNQLIVLPPLAAEMIINTENFIFFKERDKTDYKRFYSLPH